jgi:queuine/archaeosine tRNA-ribosyltransferase
MQLDHVVQTLSEGSIVEQAMERSVRWLGRCLAAKRLPHSRQALFPIVQGGKIYSFYSWKLSKKNFKIILKNNFNDRKIFILFFLTFLSKINPGLDLRLRERCVRAMVPLARVGIAIGGLV